MALAAVALGAFVLVTDPAMLAAPTVMLRRGATIVVAFFAGLLPYAYLLVRSRMDPRLDWGNPETLWALVDAITRRDFWERAWIEGPADLLPIATDYVLSLARETGWVGAPTQPVSRASDKT